MLLYILLAIAVLFILAQTWLIWKLVQRIVNLLDDAEANEQGFSELSDAYETDSLQYEETIQNLNDELQKAITQKNRFAENNSTLLHNASIDRTARHHQERTIHQLREEVAGVRRQLDIAQVIISEHDSNCLPHIVFDRFKTPDGQISLFQDFDVENNQVRFTGVIDRNSLI